MNTNYDKILAPFDALVNPQKIASGEADEDLVMMWAKKKQGEAGSSTLNSIQNMVSQQVGSAEEFVEGKIKDMNFGMQWNAVAQITAIGYLGLSILLTFAREDFVNVL